MDQDETWHAGRPRPWSLSVRWGPSFPSPERGQSPPIFGPYLLWLNGWMDQDATWQGGRPQPKRHCVRCGPSSPSSKRDRSPQFSDHICCGQMARWIKMPLGREVGISPSDIVLDGHPASPPAKGAQHPPSFRPIVYCCHGRPSQLLLSSCLHVYRYYL